MLSNQYKFEMVCVILDGVKISIVPLFDSIRHDIGIGGPLWNIYWVILTLYYVLCSSIDYFAVGFQFIIDLYTDGAQMVMLVMVMVMVLMLYQFWYSMNPIQLMPVWVSTKIPRNEWIGCDMWPDKLHCRTFIRWMCEIFIRNGLTV